jgi:multiple sugar transport system ATP-binding protein
VQTRTEVSRLQRRLGPTMVYGTHDQTEAMTLGDRVAVMRAGQLQQFATPKELYDSPLNLFVAGFMGSPAMNFLPGTVEEGKLRTPLGDLPLSNQLQQELDKAGAPRDLIVGIRPENFEDASLVSADARPHGITFPATVDVIESLGSDVFVHFTKNLERGVDSAELRELAQDSGRANPDGGDEIVARLDAATHVREGEDVQLWADVRSLHVFDPATGRNLALSGRAAAPSSAATPAADAPASAPGTDTSADSPAESPDLPAQ